jgi:autotransporter-associated beta strand protein
VCSSDLGVLKTGAGTLTLTNTNTFTGVTTISAGTLQLGDGGTAGSIANSSSISIASGAILKTNRSDTIALNQAITGAGSIEINNAGTGVTLLGSASNAYSGTTTVTSGTLQVGNSGVGTTGTGAITVQNGGSILGTGVARLASFTMANGTILQTGDSTALSSYGTLTFSPTSGSGTFDFQSGSSTILGINPGGMSDLLSFNGTGSNTLLFNGDLTLSPSAFTPTSPEVFNLLDWSNLLMAPTFASRYSAGSYSGYLFGNGDDNLGFDLPDVFGSGLAWDISGFTSNGTIALVAVAPVPEPSRAILLGIGLAALFTRRRRTLSTGPNRNSPLWTHLVGNQPGIEP